MKPAQGNDAWRRLFGQRNRVIRTLSVEFENVAELGSGAIEIDTPITLLCGENGVGKTAALAMLFRAFRHEHPHDIDAQAVHFGNKARTGVVQKVNATLTHDQLPTVESAEQLRVALGHDYDSEFIVAIDPAAATNWITDLVQRDANFKDLLEGVTPKDLSGSELSDAQALVGKAYDSVKIYEIDAFENFPTFPYFVVTYGAAAYNITEMGKGEACLLYLIWAIGRLTPKSIVLIEEPDAFVAVRSQRYLIDLLAVCCAAGDHLFVIASHSGTIAERFPNRAIQLCTRIPQGMQLLQNPSTTELIDRLALVLHRRIVAIVEDEVAGAMLKALLREIEPRLAAAVDVVLAEGNGGIGLTLKTLAPKKGSELSIVGVWDADQKISDSDSGNWSAIALPGSTAPEIEMLQTIKSLSVAEIAGALNCGEAQMTAALSKAEGRDHHDEFTTLVTTLDLSADQFARRIIPFWIKRNETAANKFGKVFREAVGLPKT